MWGWRGGGKQVVIPILEMRRLRQAVGYLAPSGSVKWLSQWLDAGAQSEPSDWPTGSTAKLCENRSHGNQYLVHRRGN